MDLNKHKYIVISGCSYGPFGTSLAKPLYIVDEDERNSKIKEIYAELDIESYIDTEESLIFIQVSLESQSSDYIADSTMYTVYKLLELGIKSENIYCYCEWTQVTRMSIHTIDWVNTTPSKKHSLVSPFILNYSPEAESILDLILSNVKLFRTTSSSNSGYVEEKLFLSSTQTDYTDSDSKFNRLIRLGREYDEATPIEEKISRYINNIVSTQNFLKVNHIDYNFVFMQGSLTNWARDEANMNIIYHKIEHRRVDLLHNIDKVNKVIIQKKHGLFNGNIESDIENVCKFIKHKFDLIDLSNVWFYKSDNIRRGGIDEWAIENFSPSAMVGSFTVDMLKKGEVKKLKTQEYDYEASARPGYHYHTEILIYGNHPHWDLYKIFWHKSAFNCNFFKLNDKFIKKLEEMFLEDINLEEGITKHGLSISKKTYFDNPLLKIDW